MRHLTSTHAIVMFNHLTLRSLTRLFLIATITLATATCASAQSGDAQVNAVEIFAGAFKTEVHGWLKRFGLKPPVQAQKNQQSVAATLPSPTSNLQAPPTAPQPQVLSPQISTTVTDGFTVTTQTLTPRSVQAVLPEKIERYAPGGPEEETVINRGPQYRSAARISAAYRGYAVQVAKSSLPLLREDPLFRQFGNIVFDRNAQGEYIYLITTEFTNQKNAEDFVKNVVSKRVANAEVVKY